MVLLSVVSVSVSVLSLCGGRHARLFVVFFGFHIALFRGNRLNVQTWNLRRDHWAGTPPGARRSAPISKNLSFSKIRFFRAPPLLDNLAADSFFPQWNNELSHFLHKQQAPKVPLSPAGSPAFENDVFENRTESESETETESWRDCRLASRKTQRSAHGS